MRESHAKCVRLGRSESIVARQCNGCYILLPFRPLLLLCVVIKPLIYIDIYPRISLVSVIKNG